MPIREDFKKVLIIGSGPIRIGQACEFDYSGTQACKALREMGYTIVLANSNPATIMTDANMADSTYIVPLNVKNLEEIIIKERPQALLPNLGGQSGLNLCLELHKAGILARYNVEVIGVHIDTIEKGEDRIAFKESMKRIGIEMAHSEEAYSVEEAVSIAKKLSYPVVVRPAFTMGGEGGGLVYNEEELRLVAGRGIAASMINQVLIEESVLGWLELELEVVRDKDGQMITVCFIENIDPMGVHTGDSYCSAPFLTVSDEVARRLQEASYKVVEDIGVIGGCNCQYAYNPKTDRFVIIEINPRTSRSSALASKATGLPIANISAQLACGKTLADIPYYKGESLLDYVPGKDYVVIKFPKWNFEKFKDAEDLLGTQMQAVGEVMSIGRTYKEAAQKAVRSLEMGRLGFGLVKKHEEKTAEALKSALAKPTSERHFELYEALKKGVSVEEICAITAMAPYFVTAMKELVDSEKEIASYKGKILPKEILLEAKKDGFADGYLAQLLEVSEDEVRKWRQDYGILPQWDAIDVSGVKTDEAYYYSTYHGAKKPVKVSGKEKIMVLGSGPNRIGQGIEFDYCCVHASLALREEGYETILINCNPETVSTDYDTSDKLYFEPLTVEDVLSIYENEKPLGVIAQFGGQTPLNLSNKLEAIGVKILGTSPNSIDLAEDRDRFREIMESLSIPMPQSAMAVTVEEALDAAKTIGYPLMCRPSYVLGGRGMEVVHDEGSLIEYMKAAIDVSADRPILIDKFLSNALECESDAISDEEEVFVPAVMEHVERAGIHSGDSTAIIPSVNISQTQIKRIEDYTKKIARALNVCGLMNMQFAIYKDTVYVLEANPRASRTVPLVSKVCNINMVALATKAIVSRLKGQVSPIGYLSQRVLKHYGVKEAIFPFNMFPQVDPILGPEMRSTGEVLGMAESVGHAFLKAQEATSTPLPSSGAVFISVNDNDKEDVLAVARDFSELGFDILATGGTYQALQAVHIPCDKIDKVSEGRPNVIDAMTNGEIDVLINTPSGSKNVEEDGRLIRKTANKYKICAFATIAAARVAIEGLRELKEDDKSAEIHTLQYFHGRIR